MSDKETVIFKIHLKNNNINNNIFFKEYKYFLKSKIIELKNLIFQDLLKENKIDINKFNFIDIENITEKIYKNYGKLYFDKGILPITYDNYKISEFTNKDIIFDFVVIPINIKKNNDPIKTSGILKKIINEENNNNEFIYDVDDFPTLGSSKKK